MIIAIICIVVYLLSLGTAYVISKNVEMYQNDGYIDVSLKWVGVNIVAFISQSLFGLVKYFIVIGWSAILLGIVILVGVCGGDFGGDGNPYEFTDGWWDAEIALFTFIGRTFSGFFKGVYRVFRAIGRFFFVCPIVWMKKNFGKLFDVSIFTIGNKPKN